MKLLLRLTVLLIAGASCGFAGAGHAESTQAYLSPTALVATPDGKLVVIACATANRLRFLNLTSNEVLEDLPVPGSPQGMALTKDSSRLFVTCSAPSSTLCVIDMHERKIVQSMSTGHTTMAPVLAPDEKTLYVCNRFNNDIAFIDLASAAETRRVQVSREPIAATITPDGKYLLVANHLYNRATDDPGVAAVVSVIDTIAGQVVKQIKLPRGSGLLRGIAISPDGRFAAVTHLVARYYLPTKELHFGRINANFVSLLDLTRLDWFRVVQLDYSGQGAANPWAISWTPDGKAIVATLAGTHEVAVLDAPSLPQKPVRIQKRVALSGNGPRALAFAGSRLYVANYFSDNLSSLDLAASEPADELVELGTASKLSKVRQGEMLFNDGRLCWQGWQSCASCHDADGRMDGLNWDLLNDGEGNPKNAKSLVWAHVTPPAMAMGVRDNAEMAVRAGLKHILFTEQPEEVASCLDDYLKSLQPLPSPWLVNGHLSVAAERGRQIFLSSEVGCARCHPSPLYTDMKSHDVGTLGRYDRAGDRFDTPALVELWRTAPYLHDGSASNLRELFTKGNSHNMHGRTSHLTKEQIDDLVDFLLSL